MKPYNVSTADWRKYNFLFFMEHVLGHKFYQKIFGETEKKLFASVDKFAAAAPPPKEPFHVIEYIKEEEHEPAPNPYYPVVYRGAAKDWPCFSKWTWEFFEKKYGDRDVQITNNVGLVGDEQRKFETIKLREYLAQMKAGTKKYLKFSQMIQHDSDLHDDFNGPWLEKFQRSGKIKKLFFLFMGGKGTATPIHNGLPPTLFVQIQGSKKWTFYPTNNRIFIGVRPDRRTYFFTNADPSGPPTPEYPLLKYASKQEVTIYPGDVLWFPPCMWHQVENTSDSMGVAYKFFEFSSAFEASKIMTTLFFFATKPLLIQSAIIATLTKREYIFGRAQSYN